ncbi:conserved membrane hypothetical protein [[Clostridium] ultunense Esp]|nr:conserved membrane hypothetical protein [[Clostridium] ultunense Esp]
MNKKRWGFFLHFLPLIGSFSLLFLPFHSSAHPLSVSYTDLTMGTEKTTLQFMIDELSVLENLPLDGNGDQHLSDQEVESGKYELGEWVGRNLLLSHQGIAQRGELGDVGVKERGDKRFVTVTFLFQPASSGEIVLQDSLYLTGASQVSYTNFLTLHEGEKTSEAILKGEKREYRFTYSGTSSTEERTSSWFSFLLLGMQHILTGYDHLLFLLSLLLVRQKMKEYVFIATAFTIAHSITLSLAVLGWITLPSRLVEVLIAASIAYVAVENILSKRTRHRRYLTFFFGLIHGLGFATILQEMSIPKSHLLFSLFSFNLGIEVVQLLLILLLLPLLLFWQKSPFYRKGLIASSGAIALFAAVLITTRLF